MQVIQLLYLVFFKLFLPRNTLEILVYIFFYFLIKAWIAGNKLFGGYLQSVRFCFYDNYCATRNKAAS